MKWTIIAALIAMALGAQAQTPKPSQRLDDSMRTKLNQEIDFIGSLYGTVYAPKAWKESHMGWDLPAQITLAHTKLSAAQDLHQAREAIGGLIRSTADYHVSYQFFATEKASLPFQVKTVEGKTLIIRIDRKKLSEASFPFSEGDELLTFDQVPVAQVIEELKSVMGANVPETDLAIADMYVTRRSARLNYNVPFGPVVVSVKRASDGSVGTVQLTWEYSPERLNQASVPFLLERPQNSMFHRQMVSGRALDLKMEAGDENPYGLGSRKSFLPDFGKRVWESGSDNVFDAYIYENEAGKWIGVVRIFGYIVDDYSKAVKHFSNIVKQMEEKTDAMIIDQNNNPGGSVFYLYSLSSMLTDQVLTVPRHRISLQASDAKDCLTFLDSMPSIHSDEDAAAALGDGEGYPMTYQLAVGTQAYCTEVVDQFQHGVRLSSPLYLQGVDKINPAPVHYTKPIVILTNNLDFSGGDFFPATMQDNKRATVVGTRTAGAGGFILQAQFPNSFGLESFSFTGSIAERVNKNPIENLGVTPDVEVPMTIEDYRGGFKHYESEVQKVVNGLLTPAKQ